MSQYKIVGTPVLRAEGPDKVRGATLYTADIDLPGMLWGKILRSPYPHALIKSINTERAKLVHGVKTIVTGADTKDCLIGKQIRDMPVLCRNAVRFVGDRVAAVAAETLDAAEEALALIGVDY